MKPIISLAIAVAACALAGAANATTVTGTLTPAYGAPLVVQTTQTTRDNTSGPGPVWVASGGELDAGYAYVEGGMLHLFFAGNMMLWLQLEGLITHCEPLDVFIDSQPGGQNTLLSNNPAVDYEFDMTTMTGLTFDPGFEPDYVFALTSLYMPTLTAYRATLPTGGGGVGTHLGETSLGGPGTLTGGDNSAGIAVTLDDSNIGGVTQGCGASSGAGVTTGMEWAIPLSAIGNPTGCIRVCAFLAREHQYSVLNQVLGPLPPGTCDLAGPGTVNFGAIAGDQFFSWCPDATPTRTPTWGALKSRYR